MDRLQQYLRETHDAGRLPIEADFELFKAGPTESRPIHLLAHHASYRGADGRPFSIARPTLDQLAARSRKRTLVVVGDQQHR
jgi:hypothetical protein